MNFFMVSTLVLCTLDERHFGYAGSFPLFQIIRREFPYPLIAGPVEDLLTARTRHAVRELRRVVEKLLQIPLSELILQGKLAKGSQWQLVQQNDGLEYNIRK